MASVNALNLGIFAIGVNFELDFRTTSAATGTLNPHTFSNIDIGEPSNNRYVFISTHCGSGNSPSSVTIGGVSATAAITNGTSFMTCDIWYAKVTTGTTADIVVTSTDDEKAIGVWRVITVASNPISDSAFYTEGGTNATVTIPTGSAAIAVNCYDNLTGSIDTGTQRFGFDAGTSEWVYGNDTITTGETGSTTFNGAGADALSVVAIALT